VDTESIAVKVTQELAAKERAKQTKKPLTATAKVRKSA
jgi:hypothetical protein